MFIILDKTTLKTAVKELRLTPIFHQLLATQYKIRSLPVCILNIGGISNITIISEATWHMLGLY